MKIAVFHELHKGGARRSVNEIAKRLKKNHQVDLYLVDEKKDQSESNFFTSIHFFKFTPVIWKGGNWKSRLYKDTGELLKLYRLHKHIAEVINNKNYDAILIHPSQYTQAPFILRFLKPLKIYYCQEPLRLVYDPLLAMKRVITMKYIYEKAIRNLRKKIDKKNISYADMILSNSLFSQSNIKNAYGKKSIVCYLGVDAQFFSPGKKQRDIEILFINKQRNKQKDILAEQIMTRVSPKYRWVTLRNEKQWFSEKGLKDFYQRAKIVLCLSRNEPFGLIPLEAGACGCVTIALNEGGFKESIIDGVTGFLLKPDAKMIAQKINILLKNTQEMTKLSHNASVHISQQWTWEKTAKKIETIVKEAIITR